MARQDRYVHELIHCENCGEDYAATYRCCPFCEERPTRGRGGGSRVNTRGGGYGKPMGPVRIVGIVLSIVLILAACAIVVTMVRSLLDTPVIPAPDDSTSQSQAGVDDPDQAQTNPADGEGTDAPDQTAAPPVTEPDVSVTGITLDYSDFSMMSAGEQVTITAAVTPADYTGGVTWTSSDPSVATVSDQGVVTAVSGGTITVTAAAGDKTAECIVRCKFSSSGGNTTAPSSGGSLTLSSTDFTMSVGEKVTLRVSGGDGDYIWAIGDSGVASVNGSGTVTGVSKGQTTLTVTSGGSSATCIVRVK